MGRPCFLSLAPWCFVSEYEHPCQMLSKSARRDSAMNGILHPSMVTLLASSFTSSLETAVETVVPIRAPTSETAPITPNARPRTRGGNKSANTACDSGTSIDKLIPFSMRNSNIDSKLKESATRKVVRLQLPMEAKSSHFWLKSALMKPQIGPICSQKSSRARTARAHVGGTRRTTQTDISLNRQKWPESVQNLQCCLRDFARETALQVESG